MNISTRSREYANRQRRRAEQVFRIRIPDFVRHQMHALKGAFSRISIPSWLPEALGSLTSAAGSTGR